MHWGWREQSHSLFENLKRDKINNNIKTTQWVKLSESLPKFKFSDFHEMLKNLAEGKRKFPGERKC
jgi:hypothetical protein